MFYAFDSTNQKISASPKIVGYCPECQQKLIPKCGEVNRPHWAHQTLTDCNYKPDSEWSLHWKSLFSVDWVEFRKADRVADLKLPNSLVVEFQHSSINPQEMKDKQAFWQDVIWIFDQSKSAHNFYKVFLDYRATYLTSPLIDSYKSFDSLKGDIPATGFLFHKLLGVVNIPSIYISEMRWLWPSRIHKLVDSTIIYDLGSNLMLWRIPSDHWHFLSGILFRKQDFIEWMLSQSWGTTA